MMICDCPAENFPMKIQSFQVPKNSVHLRIWTSWASAAFALAIWTGSIAMQAQVDVLTQHNDLARTGANLQENLLSPAMVDVRKFGLLFKRALDDQLYTQPLYVSGVKVDGGVHDVVYVTTVRNSVYAFDANDPAASAPLWHVNFGAPANFHDYDFGCTDINGNMGIIGTPVIDRGTDGSPGALYMVALTKAGGGFIQRLHALDLATGADLDGSPVEINADGFNPLLQNQRPGLALANGMVYVGYASHCDKEPYHGYLMAYDAKTLRQTAVFNTSPTGEGASIWQSGQPPAVDGTGNVYVVSGNGSWDGTKNFSESFLKLDPHLKLLDWFTPSDHFELDAHDTDINSSGATLIPGTNMVIGGGKSGVLYSLDKEHFGHLGDEHALQHFKATDSHLHSLVYWDSDQHGPLLYVWGQRDRARVYGVNGDKLGETPVQTRNEVNEGHPGAMLSLSANGGKDGILWAAIHATGDSWHESRPGILHAYDADDIDRELWNSWQNKERDDCGEYSKMAPPTIANGKVYLASFGTENSGTGTLCVYGLLPAGQPPSAPGDVHAVLQKGVVTLSWSAVPGTTYRVDAVSGNGAPRTLAAGLTEPGLVQQIPLPGTTQYTVFAVDKNGASQPSAIATVATVASASRHAMH
jgi:hypothetical protein